jgi:outer membrane receptor protein involved in Fe transport
VSRTLVLLDGVPFNDPFGGWVHWTRVPVEAADRVEIVEGVTSALYGNYAMGGVINVRTAPPARRQLSFKTQYGNRNTPQLDVVASDVMGRLGIVVNGSAFDTEGYPTVAADERGVVDTKAAVNYANLGVKLQYELSPRMRAFFRGGYFRENRDNGKISTLDGSKEENSTRWTSAAGGVSVRLPDSSDLQMTLFTDFEDFSSTFLAVPPATPTRSIGRMSLLQTVPTTSVGGSVLWSRALDARHLFSAGTDLRWVKGDSEEQVLNQLTGAVTLDRISGGQQRSFGLFAQDLIAVSDRLNVTLSARLDHWRNYDGHNLETVVASGAAGGGHDPALPDRSDTVVSPRAAATYQLSDRANVWGSLGAGFRAPTLNELYRQFRVGTVVTLANHQLGPERLIGTELGVRLMPADNLIWRATWFHNSVDDPVSNVTLSDTPSLVTRQRQNLGETRVAGLQTDVELRVNSTVRVGGGYVYNRATVTESDANPGLVGKVLPQVPRHRAAFDVTYRDPRYLTLSVQLQAVGRQFDDDENQVAVPGEDEPGLPGYAVVNLTASRELARNLEVFVGAQNLFGQEYFVGTRPTTVGAPRLVSAGVRVQLTGR